VCYKLFHGRSKFVEVSKSINFWRISLKQSDSLYFVVIEALPCERWVELISFETVLELLLEGERLGNEHVRELIILDESLLCVIKLDECVKDDRLGGECLEDEYLERFGDHVGELIVLDKYLLCVIGLHECVGDECLGDEYLKRFGEHVGELIVLDKDLLWVTEGLHECIGGECFGDKHIGELIVERLNLVNASSLKH